MSISLEFTARHHRKMADTLGHRIETAERRLQAGVDAGIATDSHTDNIDALRREQALWIQLADEIDAHLTRTDSDAPDGDDTALFDGLEDVRP